jgi:hypothetical protein
MKKRKSKGKKFIFKIILKITLPIVCAAAVFGGLYFGWKKFTLIKTERTHALVEKQLDYCQELVTAKYRFSDIISLKKSAGFAKSYSIIKYTGLIRAGISDITDVSYSVSLDGKTITLTVPAAEILGNEIVSQGVFDEKQSIWVPISTQEVFDEIDKAKAERDDWIARKG